MTVKRSTANSTGTAGAEIFSWQNDGQININPTGDGTISQAGNIVNGLSSGAGWTANGRTWACNGTGGNMTINSGSGGSYLNLQNYAVVFKTQGGTQVAQVGPQFGGAGKEGFGFGTANDVAIYRDSVGVLAFTGLPIMPLTTASALPSATTARKGARATVSDAVASPAYGATVTGGGSTIAGVLCTGSAWVFG